MKGQYIKELHSKGVYRSPFTKQKLEQLKLVQVLQILDLIEEEEEKGIEHIRKQCDYIFIEAPKKRDKGIKNNKKRK